MDVRVGLKAECQRIDVLVLWCWGRLWTVPWTAMRPNQQILKEINPEYSLEGLMLKLQYFGHLMWRADSFEKILMLGKIKGRRREGNDRGWDGWMASLTQWTWVWVNSGSWWWTGRPGVLQSTGCKELDTTEQLSWTETFARVHYCFLLKWLSSRSIQDTFCFSFCFIGYYFSTSFIAFSFSFFISNFGVL